jgi:hypothetical protein
MTNKNIQYLNKDFSSFKTKLIDFSKTYYPNTNNDFSESSPGMMLIEMVSYVGDVLSLYQENQIQENFLQFSKQRKNLLAQSYLYGYKPQITTVSNTIIDVYQIIPSQNISGNISPDFNYSLILDEGTQIQSSQNSNIKFIIEDKINFSISSSSDLTDVSIYSLDDNNQPNYYLLKKQRKSYSADIKTSTFTFTSPEKFKTINIIDDKIIKILDVIDSDGNKWYEVPYLAQETVFQKTPTKENSISILKLLNTPRRFISRFKSNNNLEIQFGSGILSTPDEEIIPNQENIGLGLPFGINKLEVAYDPSNFLYTGTYGISPSNTTLTIRYLCGGGIESNTPSNTLNILNSGTITFSGIVNPLLSDIIKNSLSFNNEFPGIGGGNGDSNDDLKLKILSSFPTQLRAVSTDDYKIRCMSLPPEYGLISKIFINKDTIDSNLLSLYILSKDFQNNLIKADNIIKQNLQVYLNEYDSLTDAINIKDAFIINLGLNFDIVIKPNYNNKLIINNCIEKLIEYFNIDKWEINQPIILSDIYTLLDNIEGVQTVKNIEIYNKVGENLGYSKYSYDINRATVNGVIYPSLDPSIFEIKNINDIQGKSVSF